MTPSGTLIGQKNRLQALELIVPYGTKLVHHGLKNSYEPQNWHSTANTLQS